MLHPLQLDVAALPASSPPLIDSSLLKAHCSVDGTDLDEQLDLYLPSAIAWAEGVTHRTVYARAHQWVLRDFPRSHLCDIRLPRGKTQSVEKIVYQSNGSSHELFGPSSGSPPGSGWQESLLGDDGARLMPPRNGAWPAVDGATPAPVTIHFTAGWLADEVPADVTHAMLFYVADSIELRGTTDFSPAMLAAGGPRFEARMAMISRYILDRWY